MQAYNRLFGNESAIRKALRPAERERLKDAPWLIRCFFGTAVERELDRLVATDPLMRQHGITGQSGSGPDYAGNRGRTFELTTNNPGTVETHANRPNPHNSGMVTYPQLGSTDPTDP